MSYCGENVHIAELRIFDAAVDGIGLALQFAASERSQPLRSQLIDDPGGERFNQRGFFHHGIRVVSAAQQKLQRGIEIREKLQFPHGAKHPFVIKLITAVQKKNDRNAAPDKFCHSQLRGSRLPVVQTAKIIVLSGLRHKQKVTGQTLAISIPSA